MKEYIKNAIKELQESDKLKIEIKLKDKDDYKKNFFRLIYNKLVLSVQKKIVPMHLKNFILRTTGMNIGHDACIPHDITIDPYFPELIYLEKGCILGGESTVITHKIKGNKLTLGKVILKERVLVGGMSILNPGAVVNKKSMLMFFSELEKEVPEKRLYGGKPAKEIMKLSKEDIDKFFKPSNMQYKEYYKYFRERVDDFLADPDKTYFKIHYNGKRLNAGNDWWRARNVLRIFYNGIIVEITRLLPHCFFKTLLLKMVGVKIGKNCKIGKGVVFDHLFCDTITLEDDVRIDDYAYLDGHEYTITQTVFGRVLIKKGAHLKHHALVRTGATIGENSVIEPYSMAQREIPANEVWKGIPAKHIRKR